MFNSSVLVRCCFAVCVLMGSSQGHAADAWPAKPIRFVLGLAPGGGTDVTVRLLANALTPRLGQNIIIENRSGAGSTIASALVARSEPDGYTFEVKTVSSAVINAFTYKKLSYDPVKDFEPVSLVGRAPLVAVVSSALPVSTLTDFLSLASKEPGKYSYASGGPGTIGHVTGAMLNRLAGIQLTHVPYRGNGPAMIDLLAGNVTLLMDTVGGAEPQLKTGRIKVLGVTTAEPSRFMPDAEPIGKVVPGYAVDTWFGIFAPAGTPKAIVDRMAAEIGAALRQPDVAQRVRELGYEPIGSTSEQFGTFWREQLDIFRPVMTDLALSLD